MERSIKEFVGVVEGEGRTKIIFNAVFYHK